jgi:hypothetical protein
VRGELVGLELDGEALLALALVLIQQPGHQ